MKIDPKINHYLLFYLQIWNLKSAHPRFICTFEIYNLNIQSSSAHLESAHLHIKKT